MHCQKTRAKPDYSQFNYTFHDRQTNKQKQENKIHKMRAMLFVGYMKKTKTNKQHFFSIQPHN